MSYQFLTTTRESAVEYLTLNRPEVRNAFNEQMIAELADWASAVSESGRRHDVRAIVLAGGVSRRLGQDKRQLRLWGTAGPMLLEYVVGIVARVCADVVVVLNDPDAWNTLPAPTTR